MDKNQNLSLALPLKENPKNRLLGKLKKRLYLISTISLLRKCSKEIVKPTLQKYCQLSSTSSESYSTIRRLDSFSSQYFNFILFVWIFFTCSTLKYIHI